MINSHNTHHTIILQPKECVDKEPWTLRNIIDFFYENPNFYINRCKTPGFVKFDELILTNNFTPVEISKYQRYYKQNYQLHLPTDEEMKKNWSLKDFMIKCYELDLKEYDEEISAKTLISVTKDALRIDSMKTAGVIGQHSLTREEFIDTFFLLEKDEVLDLNISVGIFTDRDENICVKVKPIDIRLQYKIKRSGFEEKNDDTTWDKIFRVNKMEYVSNADAGQEERDIILTTNEPHYFEKGDLFKIAGIVVKPSPIKLTATLLNYKREVKITKAELDGKTLVVGMIVKHKFLRANTFIESIPASFLTDANGVEYKMIKLTKYAEITLNDPNGYELEFCEPENPFYIKNPLFKDTATVISVTEKTLVVKSRFDITKLKSADPLKLQEPVDDCGCPIKLEITELGLPDEFVNIRKVFRRGEMCKLEYTG